MSTSPRPVAAGPGRPPASRRAGSGAPAWRGTSGALLRYRVLAYVVGVGLVVLVFVGVPLQVWASYDGVASVVGVIHGILYMVYLVTVLDLVVRARLRLGTFVAMVAAGFLPFLAFVVERWVARRLEPGLAGALHSPDGPPGP